MPKFADPANEKDLFASSGEVEVTSVVAVAWRVVSSIGRGLPTVVVMPEGPAKLSKVPMLEALIGLVCSTLSLVVAVAVVGWIFSATTAMGALTAVVGFTEVLSALLISFLELPIKVLMAWNGGFGLVSVVRGDCFARWDSV